MPGQQFSHGKGMHISVMPDTAPLRPEIHTNIYRDNEICLPSPHFLNIPSQTFSLTSPCLGGPHTISLSSFRGTGGSHRAYDCSQSLLTHGTQKLPTLQEPVPLPWEQAGSESRCKRPRFTPQQKFYL